MRDYTALVERVKAAARPPVSWRVYGQQITPDGAERYDLLLVRVPAARPSPVGKRHAATPQPRTVRRVLLNGGTHGDEPAGAEAMVRFLEQRRYERWPDVEFTVLPCSNPWGYVHDRREGPGGRDLNRSFRRAGRLTREVTLLKRALGRRRFDLFVDCHEDVDAPGLYVFAPATLGRAIVEAVRGLGPLHPGPLVDGQIPVKDAVVELDSERARENRRAFKTGPLPFYVARYRLRLPPPAAATASILTVDPAQQLERVLQATVETPTVLPLDQRAAMHLAAIDAALATIHAGPAPSGAASRAVPSATVPGAGRRSPHASAGLLRPATRGAPVGLRPMGPWAGAQSPLVIAAERRAQRRWARMRGDRVAGVSR